MRIRTILKNAVASYVTVLAVLVLLPAFLITNDISIIEEMIESMNTSQ
ncbi:hypothetical protein HNQ34_000985 [Anoxybacillus tepidamans]|uniref:Uncharacterized protein n=1 Tax=Anoxybacteroides tepidamans TaxID=265948 RepID=A0A7W8MUH1_9BACL|nr:hypothetical protein [Anoxybacillus tepidamans]MBB5323893.1 hypothetical protein [Anoxybacillus tepidamans]